VCRVPGRPIGKFEYIWSESEETTMEEKALAAAVAEHAVLAKEEAADLIRATLEGLGNQLSGGEVRELALGLPEGLASHLARHDGGAHPVPLTDFIRQLSQRTGLTEAEVTRGVRAILTTLANGPDNTHFQHALSQLPAEYSRLTTTTT
jgi:uncharacterized protein (DUF2267 family)